MEKFRFERNPEEIYTLEVNDNGDIIEFDLTDLELPLRILDGSERLQEENDKFRKEQEKILKKYDNKETPECLKELYQSEINKCKELRVIFDGFLGNGACQKIFGNKNSVSFFIQLLDQLEPHFKKMVINKNTVKQKMLDKYKVDNKVL